MITARTPTGTPAPSTSSQLTFGGRAQGNLRPHADPMTALHQFRMFFTAKEELAFHAANNHAAAPPVPPSLIDAIERWENEGGQILLRFKALR